MRGARGESRCVCSPFVRLRGARPPKKGVSHIFTMTDFDRLMGRGSGRYTASCSSRAAACAGWERSGGPLPRCRGRTRYPVRPPSINAQPRPRKRPPAWRPLPPVAPLGDRGPVGDTGMAVAVHPRRTASHGGPLPQRRRRTVAAIALVLAHPRVQMYGGGISRHA